MTLLVSWIGVDTHGTASAYIAADSRVSWGDIAIFDHGRKVFAFRHSPDILGYCGDVVFPTMVLSQIAEMADQGLLFSPQSSCKERFESIKEKLVHQFHKYPRMVKGITADILQVIHISRDPTNNLKFECRLIEWTREKGWSGKDIAMPKKSDILFILGSGSKEFKTNFDRYKNGPDRGTSRSVFHCFCDTLFNIKDEKCGGAPQLVGIYRKPESSAMTYGIIREKQRYFLGARIDKDVEFNRVEWRNDLFELCDGKTMKKFAQAQSQPDILRRN
ncbi:MAG: hypothetical protein P9M00_06615 [Candidatus Tritonobacter lacicola]|nr:hypothetical protein [Candidatus Tritonobacter lacicola]